MRAAGKQACRLQVGEQVDKHWVGWDSGEYGRVTYRWVDKRKSRPTSEQTQTVQKACRHGERVEMLASVMMNA